MSKTQTKSRALTSVASTEESPSYKRQRMKEVRALVARAVVNNQRVDLMGFEGTDIARSQIALQDLLSKEQEKHSRARGHIMNLKEDTMFLAEIMEVSVTGMMITIGGLADQVESKQHMLNNAHDECHRLAVGWDAAMKENCQLQMDKDGLKTALRATLNG